MSRSTQWNKANPEKIKAAIDRYRLAHPERVKASKQANYFKNKGRKNAVSRAYYAANREKVLARCRDNNYGPGAHEYFENRLKIQNGCCGICGKPFVATKHTHLDHNHTTGQWRSALCTHCNAGIGRFFETPELLRLAAKYLEDWANDEGTTGDLVYETSDGQELSVPQPDGYSL